MHLLPSPSPFLPQAPSQSSFLAQLELADHPQACIELHCHKASHFLEFSQHLHFQMEWVALVAIALDVHAEWEVSQACD